MSDLQIREEKIKTKRKSTTWREFVREICSWTPLVLYKNQGMISKYPNTQRNPHIVSTMKFEENRDNLTKEGKEYSNEKTFFEHIQNLFNTIEIPALLNYGGNENADFSDGAHNGKNIYLTFLTTFGCENIMYSMSIKDHCRNIISGVMITENSENIYQCSGIINGFNIFYSKYIENSSDIRFSHNLIGCRECLFCDNLTNQKYCIQNIQYSPEEYVLKKKEILSKKEGFQKRYQALTTSLGNNIQTTNSTGYFLTNCNNIDQGYGCFNLNKGKNALLIQSKEANEDMYDVFLCGRSHDFYGAMNAGGFSEYIYCSLEQGWNSHLYYTWNMDHCSYCLGCIGLKNKSFCILNKQYSKEERFNLANQIFEQMDKDGTLGQFFPGSMNPFYFNDTAAYLIDDSFTKEEVTKEGYLRRDDEIKVDIPTGVDVVETKDLSSFQGYAPSGNRTINPDILKKVIKDEKGNYYRIVPMELDFLQKHGLPLPEIHWLERIKLGFKFK